jgi:phosphatidylglycerol lysyltransferase
VALVTHVPGGLGVFEAVVLAVAPGDRAHLFAGLIVYRLVYYLLPLALAALLLAWREGARSRRVARLVGGVQSVATGLSPLLLASATFLGGGMLLLSGSLPAVHARMGLLADVMPLPVIEASHIAASLVGTALLLLAPGLYRRLDGACLAARLLLVAGAVFSLAKGIDYEEALACLAAIDRQAAPPTVNLDRPDPQCRLDHVPHVFRPRRIRVTASNSFGFGGSNLCLVLRAA